MTALLCGLWGGTHLWVQWDDHAPAQGYHLQLRMRGSPEEEWEGWRMLGGFTLPHDESSINSSYKVTFKPSHYSRVGRYNLRTSQMVVLAPEHVRVDRRVALPFIICRQDQFIKVAAGELLAADVDTEERDRPHSLVMTPDSACGHSVCRIGENEARVEFLSDAGAIRRRYMPDATRDCESPIQVCGDQPRKAKQ